MVKNNAYASDRLTYKEQHRDDVMPVLPFFIITNFKYDNRFKRTSENKKTTFKNDFLA